MSRRPGCVECFASYAERREEWHDRRRSWYFNERETAMVWRMDIDSVLGRIPPSTMKLLLLLPSEGARRVKCLTCGSVTFRGLRSDVCGF